MWLRSFKRDYLHFWMVWVRQSIRRCYRERTNNVRYGVITVQYFSLRSHFTFCHFPDWLPIVLWIPNQFSPWLGLCPCTANGSMQFTPMSRPSNLVGESLRDRALLARRTKISEQVQHILSAHQILQLYCCPTFLIIILIVIIGPWIGPALAPFSFLFLPLPFTFRCLRPINVTQATVVAIAQLSIFSALSRHGMRIFCQLKDQTAISGCHFYFSGQ